MKKQFEILRANRALILKIIENVSLEQLNKIPKGFKNNIAWNVAHLVVTQQLLCYKMSRLPVLVNEKMVEVYKKGTAPNRDVSQEEFQHIKAQLTVLPATLEEDYNATIFKDYDAYTTSANVTLSTIEEAIQFNNFHEGIHLGVIFSLKKLV